MQEEMTQQSLALSFKAVEMTADLLYKAIAFLLEEGKNKSSEKGFGKDSTPNIKRGKQSVKQLLGQGQGAESIEINSDNIGLFKSSAQKYGVDFALTKDSGTSPPTHTVFFKGKDTSAITSAFKDFVGKEQKRVTTKQSMKSSILKAITKLKAQIKVAPKKEKIKEKFEPTR